MTDARRPHESVQVYQLAHALALRVHALSLTLPKHELYEEGGQLRRASKSVAAQIVEGHALRQYKAEYVHYLARAYGSAEETVEHLRFLDETGSATNAASECHALLEEYATLCRKLFNYMRAVGKQHDATWADEAHGKMRDDR